MRGLVISVALAGCFAKPGPPSADQERRDGSVDVSDAVTVGDGPSLPDAAPICQLDDTFDDPGPPCGTWGVETGVVMTRTGGMVHATPPTAVSTAGATCTTQALQPSGTITIELAVLGNMADGNYAFFDLQTPTGTATVIIYRDFGADKLTASCGAPGSAVTYGNTHRYLRYRMVPQGSDLDVQILSSDSAIDSSFSLLAGCTFLYGAMGSVSVTFGSAIDGTGMVAPRSSWNNVTYSCTL